MAIKQEAKQVTPAPQMYIGKNVWFVKRIPNRQGSFDYIPVAAIITGFAESPNKDDYTVNLQCFPGHGHIETKSNVRYCTGLKAEQSEGKWCDIEK